MGGVSGGKSGVSGHRWNIGPQVEYQVKGGISGHRWNASSQGGLSGVSGHRWNISSQGNISSQVEYQATGGI